MTAGTTIIIVGVCYLLARSEGFRMVFFTVLGISLGLLWWLVDFSSDKPQTFFYSSRAHPAFLMQADSTCPADRHIWNHWCVK
jgi:hypothetical protein